MVETNVSKADNVILEKQNSCLQFVFCVVLQFGSETQQKSNNFYSPTSPNILLKNISKQAS